MRNLPPSTVSALFYDCLSCSYTDQRKVEADIEVTENRTGDLLFLRQRTSQLSHNRSFPVRLSLICKAPIKKIVEVHFPRVFPGAQPLNK